MVSGILPFSPELYEIEYSTVQMSNGTVRLLGLDSRRIFASVTNPAGAFTVGASLRWGSNSDGGIFSINQGDFTKVYTWYTHYTLLQQELYGVQFGPLVTLSVISIRYNQFNERTPSHAVRKPESLAAKIKRYCTKQ